MPFVSISVVVGALLVVVVGQAVLANGQVRLTALQHELSLEQSTHRQSELAAAERETPARIVAAALGQLHMVRANVVELPYVSLSVPLPTPKVTPAPAPAPAPAATTPATSTTATSTTATSTPATSTTATSTTSTGASSATGTSGTTSSTSTSSGTTSTPTATSTP